MQHSANCRPVRDNACRGAVHCTYLVIIIANPQLLLSGDGAEGEVGQPDLPNDKNGH